MHARKLGGKFTMRARHRLVQMAPVSLLSLAACLAAAPDLAAAAPATAAAGSHGTGGAPNATLLSTPTEAAISAADPVPIPLDKVLSFAAQQLKATRKAFPPGDAFPGRATLPDGSWPEVDRTDWVAGGRGRGGAGRRAGWKVKQRGHRPGAAPPGSHRQSPPPHTHPPPAAGFYPGWLWQMHALTNKSEWSKAATKLLPGLEETQYDTGVGGRRGGRRRWRWHREREARVAAGVSAGGAGVRSGGGPAGTASERAFAAGALARLPPHGCRSNDQYVG